MAKYHVRAKGETVWFATDSLPEAQRMAEVIRQRGREPEIIDMTAGRPVPVELPAAPQPRTRHLPPPSKGGRPDAWHSRGSGKRRS